MSTERDEAFEAWSSQEDGKPFSWKSCHGDGYERGRADEAEECIEDARCEAMDCGCSARVVTRIERRHSAPAPTGQGETTGGEVKPLPGTTFDTQAFIDEQVRKGTEAIARGLEPHAEAKVRRIAREEADKAQVAMIEYAEELMKLHERQDHSAADAASPPETPPSEPFITEREARRFASQVLDWTNRAPAIYARVAEMIEARVSEPLIAQGDTLRELWRRIEVIDAWTSEERVRGIIKEREHDVAGPITDLYCKFDGVHTSGLRNDLDGFQKRLEALEAARGDRRTDIDIRELAKTEMHHWNVLGRLTTLDARMEELWKGRDAPSDPRVERVVDAARAWRESASFVELTSLKEHALVRAVDALDSKPSDSPPRPVPGEEDEQVPTAFAGASVEIVSQQGAVRDAGRSGRQERAAVPVPNLREVAPCVNDPRDPAAAQAEARVTATPAETGAYQFETIREANAAIDKAISDQDFELAVRYRDALCARLGVRRNERIATPCDAIDQALARALKAPPAAPAEPSAAGTMERANAVYARCWPGIEHNEYNADVRSAIAKGIGAAEAAARKAALEEAAKACREIGYDVAGESDEVRVAQMCEGAVRSLAGSRP